MVIVNLIAPRLVELRGVGALSQQAQRRLKQYLLTSRCWQSLSTKRAPTVATSAKRLVSFTTTACYA